MTTMRRFTAWFLVCLLILVAFTAPAEARKKRRRKYSGPPPTHPMLLWSRTLAESGDLELRRVAAFKLSQYSQPIYQDAIIQTLAKCTKDEDKQIKVLCTKALGNAGNQGQMEFVRNTLLDRYSNDTELRNTIVRVFVNRHDDTPAIHSLLVDAAKKSDNNEELLALMGYFEKYGNGSSGFVDMLATIYEKNENIKVRRAVAKVLGEKGKAQDKAIELLSQCAESRDTPLTLNCLSGLQMQGRKDARAWSAVEKTVESEDPDVLLASLDVINVLPPNPNQKISKRLVGLIGNADDELEEKAILTLGVCGDGSEREVEVLVKVLDDKEEDESVRIASALILGKQAPGGAETPKATLSKWLKEGPTQSLRTACQLGLNELNAKKVTTPAPVASPTPSSVANGGDGKKAGRKPQSEDDDDASEELAVEKATATEAKAEAGDDKPVTNRRRRR